MWVRRYGFILLVVVVFTGALSAVLRTAAEVPVPAPSRRSFLSEPAKKIVLSGLRPTGRVHLGNYWGAVKNWVDLQDQYACRYFVADLHALTTDYADTSAIREATLEAVTDWLSVGLDPEKAVIFVQSQVPQTAELALIFGMITPLGWLERVPTYKEQLQELTGEGARDVRLPRLPGPDDGRHRALPGPLRPGWEGPGEPPRDLPRDRPALQRDVRRGLPRAAGALHGDAEGAGPRRPEDVEELRQHDRALRLGRRREDEGHVDGHRPEAGAAVRPGEPGRRATSSRSTSSTPRRRRSRRWTRSAARRPAAASTARST